MIPAGLSAPDQFLAGPHHITWFYDAVWFNGPMCQRPNPEWIVGYPEVGRKRRLGRSVPCSPAENRKPAEATYPGEAPRVSYAYLDGNARSGPAQIPQASSAVTSAMAGMPLLPPGAAWRGAWGVSGPPTPTQGGRLLGHSCSPAAGGESTLCPRSTPTPQTWTAGTFQNSAR